MSDLKTIAVVGGTGAEGSGLAVRWANKGHRVIIGSRDLAKATETAQKINSTVGKELAEGDTSESAVSRAQIAVLTVPFAAQLKTAEALYSSLQGKILIDVTVPLMPPKVSTVQLPTGGSCIVAVQAALGPNVRVVSAFQNVSAHKLWDLNYAIQCDVLICSNDKQARQEVIALAADAGLRGVDAGPLANSTVAEALTSVLIWINRANKVADAGIKITGLSSVSA
jgi:NADPH-dependent F420 reductase